MNIQQSIEHFVNSCQSQIKEAGDALANEDTVRFSGILNSVKDSSIVKSLSSRLSSSSSDLAALNVKLKQMGPFGELIVGLTSVAAGALIWQGAAAIATAFTFLSVELLMIIALALMAYGIYKALPAAWEILSKKFEAQLQIFK